MAIKELKKAMSDRELREYLLNREKYVRDTLSAIDEGREEGREEGLKKGHVKGRKAEKIENVKGMLKEGIAINIISRITGLSGSEIKKME